MFRIVCSMLNYCISESEISQQIISENENMNFKDAREKSQMTLTQVAKLAKYSIGTISDLENKGLGSARLKAKLLQIYGMGEAYGLTGDGSELAELVRPFSDNESKLLRMRICFNRIQAQMAEMKAIIDELENEPGAESPDNVSPYESSKSRLLEKAFAKVPKTGESQTR